MSISRRRISLFFYVFPCLLSLLFAASGCGGGGTSSASRGTRVACVGDSITYGAGIENYRTDAYPPQLQVLLGGGVVGNFGVPGATLLQRGSLPYRQTTMFRQALQYAPDTIVIQLGTNDSTAANWQYKGEFVQDAAELIARFRQVPSVQHVFICLPPPVFNDGAFGIRRDILRQEVTPLLEEIARVNNVEVIDLYTPLEDKPQNFLDGIHPNVDGAKVIAQTVNATIQGN